MLLSVRRIGRSAPLSASRIWPCAPKSARQTGGLAAVARRIGPVVGPMGAARRAGDVRMHRCSLTLLDTALANGNLDLGRTDLAAQQSLSLGRQARSRVAGRIPRPH